MDIKEKNMEPGELPDEIGKATEGKVASQEDFESWPLDRLAEYIIRTHHRYAEKQIEIIKPLLEKISEVHGGQRPELFQIKEIFGKLAGEIVVHQRKEELMVFPFIKRMVKASENNEPFKHTPGRTVEDPVKMLKEEHDIQGDSFKRIAALSNNYETPSDGCNTYSTTLQLLQEFELDLHQHIHLENDILFPKAVRMEKLLTGK